MLRTDAFSTRGLIAHPMPAAQYTVFGIRLFKNGVALTVMNDNPGEQQGQHQEEKNKCKKEIRKKTGTGHFNLQFSRLQRQLLVDELLDHVFGNDAPSADFLVRNAVSVEAALKGIAPDFDALGLQ